MLPYNRMFPPHFFVLCAVSLAVQFAAADALLDLCPPSHPSVAQVSAAVSTWVTVLAKSGHTSHMASEYGGRLQTLR